MNEFSLFTGGGIGILAAHNAGINTVAMCENDPCCQFALQKLWPNIKLFKDVRDVTKDALTGFGRIDIVSAGVPCQPTSLAGKGEAEKDKRWLWSETLDLFFHIRPTYGIFENPLGLRTRGMDGILAKMENNNYTCQAFNIPAYSAGLRHHRKRYWLVAYPVCYRREWLQNKQKEKKQWRYIANEPLVVCEWARGFGALTEVPRFIDGIPGGLLPKVRRSLLRILGNSWVYQTPYLIYKWIVDNSERMP